MYQALLEALRMCYLSLEEPVSPVNIAEANCRDSGLRRLEGASRILHLQAVWSWARYLNSLCSILYKNVNSVRPT